MINKNFSKGLDKRLVISSQTQLLYRRAQTVIPVNMLIASILVVILLPVVVNRDIFIWWIAIAGVSLARFFHVRWVLKNDAVKKNPVSALRIFTWGVFLTGLTWAGLFLGFAFKIPEIYVIFIIFALGGMSVGAVASMSSVPQTFFAFVSPMVIPPIIVFVFQPTPLGFAMSSMMLIYFVSISSTYMQSHRLTMEGLRLQEEKDELIENLKVINQNLGIANDKILMLSHTDELTQLSNRRYLDNTLEKEWARAVRSQLPIAFIMIDVDFFKEYNDTFGHQEGDVCLQKIATCMRHLVQRPGDLLARYGGEEFAAILPDTKLEGAIELAKLLQNAVRDLKIPAADTSVCAFVTISLGVASIVPKSNSELKALMAGADNALYQAKESGKDRVCFEQL